ncbi:MAG: hypothetical protein KOO60_00695 [Gemmatimonadales bacterium]|nr:hypothetical protein [Gemmatimonadales bacterium]
MTNTQSFLRAACSVSLLVCVFSLATIPVAVADQEIRFDPTLPPHGGTIPGHDEDFYFYYGLDYGSQLLIHPLRMIINGGYGILQIENKENTPFKIMYGRGLRNVMDNLSDPYWSIRQAGLWDFLSREIIPISINSGQAHYWPNYMNHLLGGGMGYRMMIEYYRYHEIPKPRISASVTLFVYHLLNEVVENNDYIGPTTDPVADFLIFNPASFLLFGSDRVAHFFSRTLHMTDWSFQPAYLPDGQELYNQGQNYVVKYHLNRNGSKSIFYHWGTHAEVGLSFTRPSGRCFSFGLGLTAKNLFKVTEYTHGMDLAASGGLFYDRHNSLLASFLYAKTKDYRYRLNVYPGLIKAGFLRPGFFLALDQSNNFMGGITFGSLRHLPFGLGRRF